MSLKPRNLIQAAEADIQRRVSNRHDGGNPMSVTGKYETYAFHRDHVRRAQSVRELLILALMHPPLKAVYFEDGTLSHVRLATTKRETKIIYSDAAILAAAVRLLTGRATWQHERDCAFVTNRDEPAPCTCAASYCDSYQGA